jgi:hypothetical protein
MGKPITIQQEDDAKIEMLKKKTGATTKIEVLRIALRLLEEDVARKERITRWKKAARVVGDSGLEVLKEFQTPNRFKKLP